MRPPLLRHAGLLAGLLCALASARAADEAPGGVDIGSRLQLFVDDGLIESMQGVDLKLHEPRDEGTVFVFDQPWEGVTSGYAAIVEDGGIYRMFYRGVSDPSYTIRQTVQPGEKIVPKHEAFVCYAESRDGITWTRPALGLFEFNGSKANNIIWSGKGAENFSVFLDTNPAAPAAERYKAVASSKGDFEKGEPELIAFVSPDGLHWRPRGGPPLITHARLDSLNIVFWDALRKHYTAIYRDYDHGVRTIKCSTSTDFSHWTEGQWADFGDAPPTHLYTNATVPYPRAPEYYFALPRRFLPWKTYFPEMEAVTPGVSDVVFMSTRDGVHWRRFEEALIRPGLDERNWAHRANTPSHGLFQTSPEQLTFYVERNYTFPTNKLDRFTIRTDGFVSAHAGYPGGEFVTKPIIFTGKTLVLNYSTSANGVIRIEIEDANGQPIPGFLLEESPLIFGDRIDEVVPWKHPAGRTDTSPLSRLAGKPVRLRFMMRDADLYSIQFK